MSGPDPSNEEVRAWALWLANKPENAGRRWEELIDSAYQLIVDMNQRTADNRRRGYYERTGYFTEQAEAAGIVTGDDDPEDALRRLNKLMDFLRASSDELTDEGREHRDQWMVQEEFRALLRLHAPGEFSGAFCAYLRDTIFPKWKLIERKKLRKT